MKNNVLEVLEYFPNKVRECLTKYEKVLYETQEIHLYTNKNIYLRTSSDEVEVNYITISNDILETLQRICDNSIYTYQNQICNGFITVKGGHRVGISGEVVIKDGQVINISYIYSLNFRIARQVLGCSNTALPYMLNIKENTVYNTIILSPPGRGKTTLLRDVVRSISNGIEEIGFRGIHVGIVDERGEIAAMYKGTPQNDVGKRTDILDNISKDKGLKMLIRAMCPQVVVADEIGTKEDIEAIKYAVTSGIKGIFTAHGGNLDDILLNPILKELYNLNIIERTILISSNREINLIDSK